MFLSITGDELRTTDYFLEVSLENYAKEHSAFITT